jgi:hypothetical protein
VLVVTKSRMVAPSLCDSPSVSVQPGNLFGGAVGVAVEVGVAVGLLVGLRVGVGSHVRQTMLERCLCPSPSSPIT